MVRVLVSDEYDIEAVERWCKMSGVIPLPHSGNPAVQEQIEARLKRIA